LFACIQQVRAQGWCVVDQELEQGLRSIAVPVYDASGRCWRPERQYPCRAGERSELEQRFLPILLAASRDLCHQLFG
jgi:IclR family pca regulon transcriptional regulator